MYKKAIAAATAGISGLVGFYLPNTLFLDNLQAVFQFYSRGSPVPVSEEINKLKESVMEDMKFDPEEKDKISLFTSSGFGFFYAGSVWKHKLLGGFDRAIIGIPVSFDSKTFDSSTMEDMLLKGKYIDWKSKAGKDFEQSLLLSDMAKKFALAQNLYYVSKCEPLVKGTFTSVLIILTIYYIENIRQFRNLQNRFKGLKYTLFFLATSFNVTMWFLCKDVYRYRMEKEADEAVAALSREYVEGGLEFYEKLLSRNVAMNKLLEDDGSKPLYSKFGNEDALIRQRGVPITARRDMFKNLLS